MKLTKTTNHGNPRWRVTWREAGRARRRFFKTQAGAKTFARATNQDQRELGTAWGALPGTARAELSQLWERAKEKGYSVAEACRFFENNGPRTAHRITLLDLTTQCLAAKKTKNLRSESLRLLGTTLRQFRRGRETVAAADVTQADVQAFLNNPEWGYWRRRGAQIDLTNLFNWGIKTGLLVRNPCAGIDKPKTDANVPQILSVARCEALLQLCYRRQHRELLPWLCLCLFAGVRPAEAEQLTWADVNLKRGFVTVAAHKAKTRARRLVPVHPTLKAWLEVCKKTKPIKTANHRRRACKLHQEFGGWSRDVLRHTFISYELARRQDVQAVALEAGTSAETIFRHYRELATPEDAAAFWSLQPDAVV